MNRQALMYWTVTGVATLLALVGVSLPWVRKRPVTTIDGQPAYTGEYVPGLETGIQGLDPVLIGLLGLLVGLLILSRHRQLLSGAILLVAGILFLGFFIPRLQAYATVERYAIEPGLPLLLISGGLFSTLGVGTLLASGL